MLPALVLLDAVIGLYQFVRFSRSRIARPRRADDFAYDRGHLAYLNLLEKINCVYCSYGNGLLAYAVEVVARTEQYWCPIKHARRLRQAHGRYNGFVDYGNAQAFRDELRGLREELTRLDSKENE